MASERLQTTIKRAGHIAVCRGRFILVWGGYKEQYLNDSTERYLPADEVWVYDSLVQTWTVEYTQGTIPPGTSGPGCAMIDDRLFVVGGYCEDHVIPSGNTNALYQLHLPTKTWEKVDATGAYPVPCDKMACWTHEGKFYIFGGFGLNPYSYDGFPKDKIEFFPDNSHFSLFQEHQRGWNDQFVMYDPELKEWTWPKWKGPKPIARAAHACAKIGNVVYISGGRHRRTRMNDIHCLNMATMTWSGRLPISEPLPQGRSWHSLTPLNNTKLILFGGFSQVREALNDCWIFDTVGLFWTQMNIGLVQSRFWHTTCMPNQDELVVVGGFVENLTNDATKHANSMIMLHFSPKSLLRNALDAVVSYRALLESHWAILPKTLQEILNRRVNR